MERNFVGPKHDEKYDSLIFSDEPVEKLEPGDGTIAHLLVRLGKYPSVGQAFRDGWNKRIPTGFSEFHVGKGVKRLSIYIWNPSCTQDEFREAEEIRMAMEAEDAWDDYDANGYNCGC
jgi:hypothetical protein